MDANTISELNALNLTFYRMTAFHFNDTRQQAWEGWGKLVSYVSTPLQVLDVGCGNGRFGAFLAQQLGTDIHYHGIDSDPTLLAFADETLRQLPVPFTLTEQDVLEKPLPDGQYNLVVAFGLLHHVAGSQHRLDFMQRLAQKVTSGGLLVFACWRFMEVESLRERVAPWPAHLMREANDYLLDWRRGTTALRYCHYVDDAEHDALVAATGLVELDRYRADGRTHALNQYSVLRR